LIIKGEKIMTKQNKCKRCGNPTKFNGFNYPEYCVSCQLSYVETCYGCGKDTHEYTSETAGYYGEEKHLCNDCNPNI
jgi:hypothetical protein